MTADAIGVIDVGTGSTRAFVMLPDGRVVAEARAANELRVPRPGHAEQDPASLAASAEAVARRAIADAAAAGVRPIGLVVSTHMHSLLLADRDGEPRSPLITWADTRAAAAATEVRRTSDWMAIYSRTGCPPHPTYPLYKLIALRAAGEAPDSATVVLDLKAWLLWRWTGRRVVDLSLASGSAMLDLSTMEWDDEALELAGVTRRQLPELVDTTDLIPCATGALGVPVGTPIVAGAGDGVLSSLGVGAHGPGTAALMVGTSGAVRVGSPAPVVDPDARLFSYYLAPRHWIVGGALSNGGLVLEWLADLLEIDVTGVIDLAASAAVGSGGLVSLPLLAGERAPGYRALARGVWAGLGLEHGRAELARSALEGIAYSVRSVLEACESAVGEATDLRATGGLAPSPLWLRILAGAIGRAIGVPDDVEGSAVGALILGAMALGIRSDLSTDGVVRIGARVEPPPDEDVNVYAHGYELFRRLYTASATEFDALAELRALSEGGGDD